MSNEKLHNKTDVAHEVFRRLLGYYGRSKRKSRGPTVLGMETNFHKFVPEASDIEEAVKEVQQEYEKGVIMLQ